MDHPMTKEESYAERRQLFKNIWETAMNMDEKDTDIMNKPKVIKTLRLDEVDRCVIGKKKKERIKNLRTVCNKILDFCDRQDADDMFYEQMAVEGRKSPVQEEKKSKKLRNNRAKKRVWRAKSLFSPVRDPPQPRATTSERKDPFINNFRNKASRNTSPLKIKQETLLKKYIFTNKTVKKKANPTRNEAITSSNLFAEPSLPRRKVDKKRHSKRIKPPEPVLPQTLK